MGPARDGSDSTSGRLFRIGTAAQLTGLDPHTIRAWERRYRAVSPVRTAGGTRLYRDADVARLQLIKALTDCGDAIGAVAHLDDDALRARLAAMAGLAAPVERADDGAECGPLVVAALGAGLAQQLRAAPLGLAAPDLAGTEVAIAAADRETLQARLLHTTPAGTLDVLLVDLEALGDDPVSTWEALVGATDARVGVVVYQFARRHVLARLAERGARLLRGPLPSAQLARSLCDFSTIERARRRHPRREPVPDTPPPAMPGRLFDDVQLARLRELHSTVDCECPSHLSSLVTSLLAFEEYSRRCERRTPADAALHGRLALGSARARALVEQLLVAVCEQDGIRV